LLEAGDRGHLEALVDVLLAAIIRRERDGAAGRQVDQRRLQIEQTADWIGALPGRLGSLGALTQNGPS